MPLGPGPRTPPPNCQRLAIAHNSPLKDALLVLDDCFDHPSTLDNDMMRLLYKQGRHLRSSVWCIQHPGPAHPPAVSDPSTSSI